MRVSKSLNFLPSAASGGRVQIEVFKTYFDTLPSEVLQHISGMNNPTCQFRYGKDDNARGVDIDDDIDGGGGEGANGGGDMRARAGVGGPASLTGELHILCGELDMEITVNRKNNCCAIEHFIECLEKNEFNDITISPFISISIREDVIPFLHGLSVIEFKNTQQVRSSLAKALMDFVTDIRKNIDEQARGNDGDV